VDIGVALKWVDLRPEVDPLSGHVFDDDRFFGLSPADEAALEMALQTVERWGGRVVAVTLGPPAAEAALRAALAAGAGVARRVSTSGDLPSEQVAAGLAPALAGCDLVWCGAWSFDRGSGSVPAFLAARLGRAQALGLTRLEWGNDPGRLVVERRLDRGRRERLAVDTPAVLSVEAGVARLRRASLRAVMAADAAAIEVEAGATAGAATGPVRLLRRSPFRPPARVVAPPAGDTRQRILALTGALSERTPPRTVVADPDEAAREVVAQLRAWGYVT
jgi:electron transfer flavoprotein beta subunit